MMKALLHIGTGKTGSTSIQEYMAVNRQLLLDQGIHYPTSLGPRNHRRLPAMVQKDGKPGTFFRDHGLADPESRQAARDGWWREFQAEIGQAVGCERCLISAEHMARLDADEVADLRDRLATLFDEVRVIVYLRDPVEYAVSMYDTALKVGSVATGPAAPVAGGPTDYAALLRIWMDAFGADRLTVRLFDRAELSGGDILEDFTRAAGIDTTGFMPGQVRNSSLGVLGQQLLLRVNRRLPRHRKDGNPVRGRAEIPALFERFLADGKRLTPDPGLVAAYAETFAASNEWVRQTFFPDRATLFPARHYPPAPEVPLDADTLDRLADLLIEIWQRSREVAAGPSGTGRSRDPRAKGPEARAIRKGGKR